MLRGQSSKNTPGVGGRSLALQHLAYLKERAIPAEVAEKAGLTSVSGNEAAVLLGRDKSLPSWALAIPYDAKFGQAELWRVRPDDPDGARARWLTPSKKAAAGMPVRPYLPPPSLLEQEVWGDTSRELIIVESPIKALSVMHNLSAVAVGLAGVSTGGETGQRRLHAELRQRVSFEGRRVVILFDSNRLKPQIRAAERTLARQLHAMGASVFVAVLPSLDGKDTGPDDFLFQKGAEPLRQIIDEALPWKERFEADLPAWIDKLERGKERILPSLGNAVAILTNDPRWDGVLAFDEFANAPVFMSPPPFHDDLSRATPPSKGEPWEDLDSVRLAAWLSREWNLSYTPEKAFQAMLVVAHKSLYHPVREWLGDLSWDGVSRVDTWLSTHFGAVDSPYTRAVGAAWLISLVARAYQPGCQVKYCLILEGAQDLGKSRAISALIGQRWFTDEIADFGSKDAAISLRAKWCVELAELDSLGRAESNRAKAFLSRQVDHYRPPYGRIAKDFPRQCCFIGTTNESAYLKDATGSVRFWPVSCEFADADSIVRDREQLFAEAFVRFYRGEAWHLQDRGLIAAAREEQQHRYQSDAWGDLIDSYLQEHSLSRVTIGDILSNVLRLDSYRWGQTEQNRVARALQSLGWTKKRMREAGRLQYFYIHRSLFPLSVPGLEESESRNTSGNSAEPFYQSPVPAVPTLPTLQSKFENDVEQQRATISQILEISENSYNSHQNLKVSCGAGGECDEERKNGEDSRNSLSHESENIEESACSYSEEKVGAERGNKVSSQPSQPSFAGGPSKEEAPARLVASGSFGFLGQRFPRPEEEEEHEEY